MRSTRCGFDDSGPTRGSSLLLARGPTLIVDIGFDEGYHLGNGARPVLAMRGVKALVDTGAAESCIDSRVAMVLNLPIIDQRPVAGITGGVTMNLHLAQIYCPDLDYVVTGRFTAVELAAGGQAHDALIGRDFLQAFKLMYDGTSGQVHICHPGAVTFPQPRED